MHFRVHKLLLPIVLLGFLVQQSPVSSFDIRDFLKDLVDRYATSDPITFLDEPCNYSTRPTFSNLKLIYKTKFWCSEISPPITGNGNSVSPSGSLFEATRDFAKKALELKIFTAEQLKHWL